MKRRAFASLTFGVLLLIQSTALWAQAASKDANLGVSRFLSTSDGVKLHYLDAGKGRPIVFVPGWTMTADTWEPQILRFSSHYRTVALDPRSHGFSEVATDGHTLPRLGKDIHELIESLELTDVVLVAWSMAVKEVLTYIERFGTTRLGAVVLVDGSVFVPEPVKQCSGWIEQTLKMRENRNAWANASLRPWFNESHPKDYVDRIIQAHLRTPTIIAATLGIQSYCGPEADKRDVLNKLDKPLMYVVGSAVGMKPSVDTIKARVPGARIEYVGKSHAPHLDAPEPFNQVFEAFLRAN